jgi:hypothetical protein
MKSSRIGVVVAAILMLVAAVGFGIAQAGVTNTIGEFMEWQTPGQGSSSSPSIEDRPVLSFEDQVALEQSDSSSPYARVLPSGIDLDYDAGGNLSLYVEQERGPVETGSLPAGKSNEDFDPFSRGGL